METDICALHDYAAEGAVIDAHFADRQTVEAHGCLLVKEGGETK